MVGGIVNKFKCSSFVSFLHLHVRTPQFLFFLPPFARTFMALHLKQFLRVASPIIRQCTITLTLYRCPPLLLFWFA